MPAATVLICTHDRATVVGRAVAAALTQARAEGAEVVVVDNASTDGTAAALDDLRRTAPELRVVHEPRLGLSAARNRGLAAASGPVSVFLDDDAVPRPGWLAALLAPYATPEVACVGGRICLAYDDTPPPWLSPALHPALSEFDAGDLPRRLRYGHENYPYGANISFQTDVARRLGGFSTAVGPVGRHPLVHDETDLCYRVERAGGEVRYAPDAIVDHQVLRERLTPAWFLARFHAGGRSAAVFVLRNRGLLRALWRIRWLYAADLFAARYVPRDPVDPTRLARECRRQEALGYLRGVADALPRLRAIRREARMEPLMAAAAPER